VFARTNEWMIDIARKIGHSDASKNHVVGGGWRRFGGGLAG